MTTSTPIELMGGSGRISRRRLVLLLDVLFSVVIWIISFLILNAADEGFSYDWVHYIKGFDSIRSMQWQDINNAIVENIPYPYISVPPWGLYEVGFGLAAWSLSALVDSPAAVYAIIGASSISSRSLIMRRLGVAWPWVILLNLYAVTLFEANAIRLGCAFTLLLLGVFVLYRRGPLWLVCSVMTFAALFHLQSLFFSSFFLLTYYGYHRVSAKPITLLVLSFVLASSSLVFLYVLSHIGLAKLEDYSGKYAASGGVNIVSALGTITILISIKGFVAQKFWKGMIEDDKLTARIWTASLISAIPALMLLIFASGTGALGDRVWQLAYVMFSVCAFMDSRGHAISSRAVRFLIIALTFISVINVLFRYPLSNFFYPLVSYEYIYPYGL